MNFQTTLRYTLAFCLVGLGYTTTLAQSSFSQGSFTQGSGTQGTRAQGSGTQGSSMQGAASQASRAPIAMNGYCPVCILDMRKWVKGDQRFAVLMDGKTYLFPGEAQKQTFLKNTTKYTPALNGNCVVCFAEGGSMVAGSVNFTAIHKQRLYMFPSEKEKLMFMDAHKKYESVDLAFGGMCAVCRADMQQNIPGKPEFGTIHAGKRYYFPSQEQKMMFLANKSKYAEK